MVHHTAGRFQDRREPIEDFRQVAALGLARAIDHFAPSRRSSKAALCPSSLVRSGAHTPTGCGSCGCTARFRSSASRCASST
ncbi:hypothetical protein [Streptomyces sp. MBT84]|uniref:hypothetical protein n=1 Tax=Streptomyces sp. MBT84 TaxID=1488414 RepID=UPI0027DEBA9D|nr:hypothetical protein [Streptomyces sp. MBT84]